MNKQIKGGELNYWRHPPFLEMSTLDPDFKGAVNKKYWLKKFNKTVKVLTTDLEELYLSYGKN